ncbi:MAG: hypothetical protein HYZ75_11385 [Elusimicrobia bacterium]|nr:hypothetical protein [Elusimicrobiota bacterium]
MEERRENRWVAPVSLALLASAVVLLGAMAVRDPDTWWHLAAGRLVFQSGIPKGEPFSFVLTGRPWVSFEWLSQALFWGVWSAGGAAALILFKGAVAALGYGLVWRWGKKSPVWSALLCVLAALSARHWLVERPFIFDLSCIGLAALILGARFGDGPGRRAWLLVPLTALWANLHGAAALAAPAMCLSAALAARLRDSKVPFGRWAALSAAAAAAVLLNPHGWGVLEVAWRTAAYPGKELIKEWNTPWWELGRPFGLWLLVSLAAVPRAWRQGSPWAVWTAGTLAAAFWAERSIPLFLLCAPACAAAAWEPPGRRVWGRWSGALRLAGAGAIAAAAGAVWHPGGGVSLAAQPALRGAAAFLAREGVAGPVFNEYESGGPLIFSGVPVFIDGRNAEYPAEHFRAALSWHRPEVWAGLDARWAFNAAVVRRHPTGAWTTRTLDESPAWRLVYWDDEGMVYLKAKPENAAVIERLGYRLLYPGRGHHQWVEEALARPNGGAALLAELARSTTAAPGGVNARLLAAYALARVGRLADAAGEARAAASLAPGQAQPLFTLGWTLETAGDLVGAESAYRAALSAVGPDARAAVGADLLNNLGRLAEKRGDRTAAAALYRKSLSWNKGQGDALANLRRLEGF